MNVLKTLGPDKKLPAYTLTELLVVLVIIGILVLLALPNYDGIMNRAYSTEAKMQLEALHQMQKAFFYENSRYSEELADVGFTQQPLTLEGGSARYRIEVVEVSQGGYRATATSVVDFDQDGQFNVWEINQQKEIKEITKD